MRNNDYGIPKPEFNMHRRKCEELRKIRVEIAKTLGVPELVRDEPCNFNGQCQGTCPACYMEEKALMDRIYELSKNGVAFTLKEDELKKEREPIPFIFDAPPVPPMPPRPPIVQGLLRPEPFEPLDSPIVPTLPISQPKEKKRGIFDKIKKEK